MIYVETIVTEDREGTLVYSPDEFIEHMLDRLEKEREAAARNEPWAERRVRLLRALADAAGGFGDISKPPLALKRLEYVEYRSFVRERVEYTAGAGLTVPAYVVSPKGAPAGKRPAIVALHGHGWGSREMVGLLPDGRTNADVPTGHGRTVRQLVERGFVVFVPEIVGFGDRRLARDEEAAPDDPKRNSCFPLAAALLMAGKTLAGLRAFEASRAVDALRLRDDVDPERIGMIGFSGGGMVASLAAALDERVRAVAIYGYSNTYRDSVLARRHCLDNYIPGILRHAEMPELLALLAPRPLFLESGLQDPLFPERGVRQAAALVAAVYEEMGRSGAFDFDLFEGGHEMNGRRSFDWLKANL